MPMKSYIFLVLSFIYFIKNVDFILCFLKVSSRYILKIQISKPNFGFIFIIFNADIL